MKRNNILLMKKGGTMFEICFCNQVFFNLGKIEKLPNILLNSFVITTKKVLFDQPGSGIYMLIVNKNWQKL